MKRVFGIICFLVFLIACGSSSNHSNRATGAWSETLSSSSGQQLGNFTFDISQNNLTLTGSNVNFSGMGALSGCFGAGTTMSGQMGAGMMNGGTMNMMISWTQPGTNATNTLTMQGNMASGMMSGSGTFTLAAQTAGCMNESGNFTMSHTSNSMM